jgi:hypothetical protein
MNTLEYQVGPPLTNNTISQSIGHGLIYNFFSKHRFLRGASKIFSFFQMVVCYTPRFGIALLYMGEERPTQLFDTN